MAEAKKAAFRFTNFKVPSFSYKEPKDGDSEIKLGFTPSGIYNEKTGVFSLKLIFTGIEEKSNEEVIKVESISNFKFSENLSFDSLPDYFYSNSIAIIFPYLRSFVSTLTLQANTGLIILDLMNLTGLKDTLIENSRKQD